MMLWSSFLWTLGYGLIAFGLGFWCGFRHGAASAQRLADNLLHSLRAARPEVPRPPSIDDL